MFRQSIFKLIILMTCVLAASIGVAAQETYTGTVISYGSRAYTGIRTANFTLRLKSRTSDDDAQRSLASLQSGGQDALMDSIKDQDLGSFSLNNNLARTVNAVRQVNNGNTVTIYAVFERWTEFAEVRGGYRSLDYPFGYIELTIDPSTGKGTGKYFAAAKIRWVKGKKDTAPHVEIEDYATFPAKLANVRAEGMRP